MNRKAKNIFFSLILCASFAGCQADVTNRVGVSTSGYIIGLKALYGNGGLSADGASQATIRVEVFTNAGKVVDDKTVTLTTTLGTLGSKSLAVVNGVATTTLTAGTVPGTAYVVATVENISATAAVQIVNFSSATS